MPKSRLNQKALRGNNLGEVVLLLSDSAGAMSAWSRRLARCYVNSLDTGEPVVDPFMARPLISTLVSDSTIARYLDDDLRVRLKADLLSQCEMMANSFDARLRPFCEDRGISLEGRFPRYVLSGFLELTVEQSKGTCAVGGRAIKSLMLESIAPALFETLQAEADRPFDESSFRSDLYEAYQRATRLGGLDLGRPVSVLDVFRELVFVRQPSSFRKNPTKRNYSEYVKEHFSRDLARIASIGTYPGAVRLQLLPTAFPHEEGLPIRIEGSVRYVGRLAFAEVTTI